MLEIKVDPFTFYWRMTDTPGQPANPVPDFVDFSLTFREDVQLVIQKKNTLCLEYLECIYKEAYNVGYLQEGHDLAASYGGDVLSFIKSAISRYTSGSRSLSEIGAGGCYILKQMKDAGYQVSAIDPSPICHHKAAEFGIDVIPTFYPAKQSLPKSDIIFHYDVLEHVEDPSDFLSHHVGDLNPGGLVIFAVPDCTSYIERGDVSMLLHEHLNYYDADSLSNVVRAAGLEVMEITASHHGAVLYCAAKVPAQATPWVPRSGDAKFSAFQRRFVGLQESVKAFIADAEKTKGSLGCYIPLRTFPYLGSTSQGMNLRFFDDNASIYGQYFDGFDCPVENMGDLVAKPVTHLLILSSAFGDKIRHKLRTLSPDHSMKIWCLSDYAEPK